MLLCHLRKLSGQDRLQTEKGGFSRFPLQTHQPIDVYKLIPGRNVLRNALDAKLNAQAPFRTAPGCLAYESWAGLFICHDLGSTTSPLNCLFLQSNAFWGHIYRERERKRVVSRVPGIVTFKAMLSMDSANLKAEAARNLGLTTQPLRFITTQKNLWDLPGSKIAHTWSQQGFRILVVCVI